MADMQPSLALRTCEQALRQLLDAVMQPKVGEHWLDAQLSQEKIEGLKAKRDVERRRRQDRGTIRISENLLDYTEFHELVRLADKNWSELAVALGDKKTTGALLNRFEALRNTVAHSRDLLPFEIDLLSGIAGEIRNRVAIFMSDRDSDDQHYPRIERAVDCFGNEPAVYDPRSQLRSFVRCKNNLHPGDVVSFHCRGTDPQGRELTWWLQRAPTASAAGAFDSATGDNVSLTWTVDESDVANLTHIMLDLKVSGARYHRHNGGFDQLLNFSYRVLPPRW